MVNYKNGKIYKIVNITSNDPADCYVGSTCNSLSKRMADVMRIYKTAKPESFKPGSLYDMMRQLGPDNFRIELIQDYPCEISEQLKYREIVNRKNIGAKYSIHRVKHTDKLPRKPRMSEIVKNMIEWVDEVEALPNKHGDMPPHVKELYRSFKYDPRAQYFIGLRDGNKV